MRSGEGGGVRRGLGIERRGDHDGELCPRPEGSGRGRGRGARRTHVKPLDSFVSASTSAWQFSHHGSAARALIVPGHAAHARVSRPVGRGPICSPSVGRDDDDERAVGRRRPGRAADWNLARRAPEVEVLTRRRPFGTHFDPRSDTRRPTPFGRRARDGRTDHRHRGRPRRPLRRAHRAGARRARPPLGQMPLPRRQQHQGHLRHQRRADAHASRQGHPRFRRQVRGGHRQGRRRRGPHPTSGAHRPPRQGAATAHEPSCFFSFARYLPPRFAAGIPR